MIKYLKSIIGKLFPTKLIFKKNTSNEDDYIWEDYHSEYRNEIINHAKKYLLNLPKKNTFNNNKLFYKSTKKLHPNHQTLYEVIKALNPKSIIELGCGGGFHVSNLKKILPKSKIIGLDRSPDQVNFAKMNYPNFANFFLVKNFSSFFNKFEVLKYQSDIIYSQAVLMHIQKNTDYESVIKNTLLLSKKYIVLVESWPRHDFVEDYLRIKNFLYPSMNLFFYIKKNPQVGKFLALIISKKTIYNSKKYGLETLNISKYAAMQKKHLLKKI